MPSPVARERDPPDWAHARPCDAVQASSGQFHMPRSLQRNAGDSHAEFRPIRCAYAPRCERSAQLESVAVADRRIPCVTTRRTLQICASAYDDAFRLAQMGGRACPTGMFGPARKAVLPSPDQLPWAIALFKGSNSQVLELPQTACDVILRLQFSQGCF